MMKKAFWVFCFLSIQLVCKGQSGCPNGFENGQNLIKNGSFQDGLSGFYTDYKKNTSKDWFAGSLYVTDKPNDVHNNYRLCLDSSFKNLGKMLVVDGAQDRNKTIWQQTVALESNKEYYFSLFFATLLKPNPAQLDITINNQRLSKPFNYEYQHCRGSIYFCFWSSGPNKSADIRIRASTTELMGNDFVIDNIQLFSCTKSKTIEPSIANSTYNATNFRISLSNSAKTKVVGKLYFKPELDSVYQVITTDSSGRAQLTLNNKNLHVAIHSKGYFVLKDTLIASPSYKDSMNVKNYILSALDSGTTFTLPKLTFDKSSSTLTDDNKKELQALLDLLIENPEVNLEINGHTDNQGDALKNYNLSLDRVNNVKKFLVEKGIASTRINGTGFGGTKPLVGFGSDEERKINRRVEFVIVKRR